MRKLFIGVWTVFAFLACEKQSIESFQEDSKESIQETPIVLKERDPNSPLILSKVNSFSKTSFVQTEQESFFNYLGRSFIMTKMPLSNPENFKKQIIDIERFRKDHPNSFMNVTAGVTEGISFTYAGFQRYVDQWQLYDKVNESEKLSLKVFSESAQKSMEAIFGSEVNEKNRVFGELHSRYIDSNYRLKKTSRNIRIMRDYLLPTFAHDLYNTTSSQVVEKYGKFMLCNFITGREVFALYSGKFENEKTVQIPEQYMKDEIDASFGVSDSGAFGIGKAYAGSKENSEKLSDLKVSVRTFGGIGGIENFTEPEDVNEISIDLSQWMASIWESDQYDMIGIAKDGLVSISEFVEEDNLKYNIDHSLGSELYEPTIVYIYLWASNKEIICLSGRFEDVTPLYCGEYVDDITTKQLIDRYTSKYKIKTVDHSYLGYATASESMDEVLEWFPLNYKADEIIGDQMKKCVLNNKTYLISQKEGVKFAFSIHDDYLLDTYGIREWVNGMSTIQMDSYQLDWYYTIVAL